MSEVVVDPGTDLITSLLGRLAHLLNIDFDIATWSRMIGLVLIGSIIVANMRNVLGSVSRVSRVPSVDPTVRLTFGRRADIQGDVYWHQRVVYAPLPRSAHGTHPVPPLDAN